MWWSCIKVSSAHLVEFISLGSYVIHQDLVGCQLVLDGSPRELRLLQPHPAPQFMDHLNPKSSLEVQNCILEKYLQILTQSWMSNWPSSLSVSTWLLLLETFSMKEVNSTASVTRARHTARKCESASDGRARWCLNIYQCQMMLVVVVILLACWASFSSFIF